MWHLITWKVHTTPKYSYSDPASCQCLRKIFHKSSKKSSFVAVPVLEQSVSEENWRWRILNIESSARNSCLAELKEHSCRAETISPAGLSVPVVYAWMYLFVSETVHACLHLYMHLRDSCDVCVPCVQPAGTVWGLCFAGPGEGGCKAGRMGLPCRPWRVWRGLFRSHNQDNSPKTCWSSQWNWEINKCAITCPASKSTRWEESFCGPAQKSAPGLPSLQVNYIQKRLAQGRSASHKQSQGLRKMLLWTSYLPFFYQKHTLKNKQMEYLRENCPIPHQRASRIFWLCSNFSTDLSQQFVTNTLSWC